MIKRKSLSEKINEQTSTTVSDTAVADGTIYLGIDPGTNFMGYALIKIEKASPQVITLGVIKLNKFDDPYQKLAHIFNRVSALVTQYTPTEVALEAPFYANNVQSVLKLGRAQGVAMAAALSKGIDVFEYMPTEVKQSVVGSGRASKEQVAGILQHLLGIDPNADKLDATDALAVALCHYFKQSSPTPAREKRGKSSSWQTYINKNQDKI